MIKKYILIIAVLAPVLLTANGCTTAVVAGAAAAGGYIAHDKGYRVRNPVTKSDSSSEEKSE
ncbi:MAG: hypothetical protein KDI68_14835 [Gammaproteobacteria bacterium]|nr:hypothetical protein [Gammaproteobacteria bacterium]